MKSLNLEYSMIYRALLPKSAPLCGIPVCYMLLLYKFFLTCGCILLWFSFWGHISIYLTIESRYFRWILTSLKIMEGSLKYPWIILEFCRGNFVVTLVRDSSWQVLKHSQGEDLYLRTKTMEFDFPYILSMALIPNRDWLEVLAHWYSIQNRGRTHIRLDYWNF